MKKAIPKFLKLFALFAVFLLFGCSKDFYDEELSKSSKNYKINNVSVRELFEENKFSKAYYKISKIDPFSDQISKSKTTFENEYGFTIVDIPAIVIEYDGKTTYTLKIVKDSSQTNELDNLLIVSDALNGSKSYLINYKLLPTTNEQATKVIDSNEPIIKYEIAFDPNASFSSKFSSDCIELIIIYCSDSNYYCGGTDTAHGCYQTTTISCGGGGSEIGSSSDSSGGNAGSGMLTSPVGTNPHGGAGGSGNDLTPPNPCEKLKNLFDPAKANIKPNIVNDLQPNIAVNPSGEKGVLLTMSPEGATTNFVISPTQTNSVNILAGGNRYSAIHTQPLDTYPMFSWSDVVVLNSLNNHAAPHNQGMASFLLVCQDDNGDFQTYAIVFDPDSLNETIDQFINNPENIGCTVKEISDKMDEVLGEEYRKDNNYERAFLKFMLNSNVSLYKANSTLTNWSKLSLSNNSATARVISKNCN